MKVFAVDDHPMMLQILRAVTEQAFPGAEFVTASSLAEAIEKARGTEQDDLVLLDLGLPDSAGVDTLRIFRAANAVARVIVVSALDDRETVAAALSAGAVGYIPKTSSPSVIVSALKAVAEGGSFVPTNFREAALEPSLQRRSSDLTERQREVLCLISKGFANKEIARRLLIAEDTVKQHARAAYAALGVSSRVQAVHAAMRLGIQLD